VRVFGVVVELDNGRWVERKNKGQPWIAGEKVGKVAEQTMGSQPCVMSL